MIRTERRCGGWDGPSAQTDFVSVMRKVKAVGSVAEMCSFLFVGTGARVRIGYAVICDMSYVLQGTSDPRMIWEAIPGREGGRGGPTVGVGVGVIKIISY